VWVFDEEEPLYDKSAVASAADVRTALAKSKARAQQDDVSDLDAFLAESFEDDEFRRAFEDAEARVALIRKLQACRKARSLSQLDVAQAMETSQSAVSELESGDTDPRLSTVQRYARAVGHRAVLDVELDWARTFWTKPAARPAETVGEVELDWSLPRKVLEAAYEVVLERYAGQVTAPAPIAANNSVDDFALAS
jgi:transcriptional regulator with XRE-family HTH domain